MGAANILLLFLTLLTLALTPDGSSLLVCAKTLHGGLKNAFSALLGIILGDLIFILIAIYGLGLLAKLPAKLWLLFQLLATGYLLWLGWQLWRAQERKLQFSSNPASLINSFNSGLSLTLADPKAIAFYLSYLPTVLAIETIKLRDVFSILACTIAALFLAKGLYALLALKLGQRLVNLKGSVYMYRLAALVIWVSAFLLLPGLQKNTPIT